MTEFEFTLKFRLPDADADPVAWVDALAAAGCDDAMLGLGQRGRIALAFVREARTAVDAMVSAIRDVHRAIPGAELVEAAPDLVGLSDVASIVGCTRQNIRKLMLVNAATFPPAVHEGASSLWHLQSVLAWFREYQKRPVDPVLLDVADVAMNVNIANAARRVEGDAMQRKIRPLFR